MKKNAVVAVFDRKKKTPNERFGTVELRVYLSHGQTTYVTLRKCTLPEWRVYQKSDALAREIKLYSAIVEGMEVLNEEMTVAVFRNHLGATNKSKKKSKSLNAPNGFVEYVRENAKSEGIRPATLQRKMITADSLEKFGKLCRFSDITLQNVRAYDKWLRKTDIRTENEKKVKGSTPRYRSDVCISNYHKIVRMYTHDAMVDGLIESDPYDYFDYPRGKNKERRPLTENELVRLRELDLDEKLDRVRDLFIFCAYTGLAYADSQLFVFKRMTEKHGDLYYIDGSRLKSGSNFYTPILPPAMDVLEKYSYELPKISNQKLNDYLHVIEKILELNKPMTSHIARHSFGTLVLTHKVPIANLARMMGHKDIKTTQVYAKILQAPIQEESANLVSSLL